MSTRSTRTGWSRLLAPFATIRKSRWLTASSAASATSQILRAPDVRPLVPGAIPAAPGAPVLQQCQRRHPAQPVGGNTHTMRRSPGWKIWPGRAGRSRRVTSSPTVAEAEIVHVHDETPRERVQPLPAGSHGLQAHLTLRAFRPVGFFAPGKRQHRQRPVACCPAKGSCWPTGQHFLVPLDAVLGHLPGLPPLRPAHLAAAPDILLPARYRRPASALLVPAGRANPV